MKVVKYAKPIDQIEEAMRFVVVEDNGDRLFIRLIDSSMYIQPTELVSASDVVGAWQ